MNLSLCLIDIFLILKIPAHATVKDLKILVLILTPSIADIDT